MTKTIIIVFFLIIGCLLQHVSHELLHVFVAKKTGLTVKRIQWFTYHGGTKVFIDGEEQILGSDGDVPKEWVYTNLAGIIGTTILAYIFCAIYFLLDVGYLKLFIWELAMIFLLTDSSYALICSFGNCGDFYLVNKKFNRINLLKCLSVLIFIINCTMAFIIYKYL